MSWEEYSLSEVSKYWMGKTDASLMNSEIFISTENMIPGKGGIVKSSYVPNSGKVNSYSENDILVSNIRPYFKKIWLAQKPGGCSNDVLVFRPNDMKVLPKFLYYQLSCDSFFNDMVAGSNGTKMPRGNKVSIMNYRILCPSLPIQKRIADILSTYDNLIENNLQRINHLEAMAICEYKILMKESEVEKVKLSLHYDTSSGGTPSRSKPDYFKGSIPWFKTKELQDNILIESEECITENALKNSSAKLFKEGTVLLALYGATIGRVGLLTREATTNQACCAIIPKSKEYSNYFIYLFLLDNKEYIIGFRMGAAQENISQEIVKNLDIPLVSTKKLNEFNLKVGLIYKQVETITKQNTHLRQIRDTLLPKLMSGQIDVSKTIPQAKVVEMPLTQTKVEKKKDSADKPKAGAKYYFRTVLASYIVNKLWQENTFGHVKLMKLMYLCEHLAEIETVSNYHRDAAGPYDNQMIRSIDKQMKDKQWFEMYKHEGKFPKYKPLQKHSEHQAEFLKYYGEKQSGVDSLIERFRKESTEKIEMVATIYEAWRGLYAKNNSVIIEDILNEVLNKWHESKNRISKERWMKCHEWMVEKGWVL